MEGGAGREEDERATDDVLMERYARGDARAFEELYSRWETPLFAFLLRFLADRETATDVFQEVWLRVVESRHGFRPSGRFRSWLFTVARSVCVDQARRGERSRRRDDRCRADREGSPEEAPLDEELARSDEIVRLLAPLPSAQREALLLSKYYGFTYGEIASMSGGTEAAVKQKVYRALRSLRERG